MSSSANRNLPRLELPNWLPLPVADEARVLYDSVIKPNQTVERYVEEPDQTIEPKANEEVSGGHHEAEPTLSQLGAVVHAIKAGQERYAEKLRSMTFEQVELLCRLVSNEQMKNVWRELYRKTSGGGQFLNPAKRLFGGVFRAPHDPTNQDMAAREFFSNAFGHAAWPAPLMTRDDYKSKRKPFNAMAAKLREDAQRLRSLALSEFAPNLEAIAAACEERGPGLPVHHPVVTRSRGDEVVRGFVLRMNFICHFLFEKELHGTVATTARVAFSKKNFTADQVRNMVRAHCSSGAPMKTWLTTG
jgi:hypothetical protein